MYCPQCNYPVPAKTETCPNCSHIFMKVKPPSGDSADPVSDREKTTPGTGQAIETADASAKSLNKKVMWAAIFVLAPFMAIVFTVLSYLTRDVSQVQNIMSVISAFLMFLSLVLVPAALIMGFLGFREIKKAPGKTSGKGLSIAVMIFSLLIIISGPIYGIYIFSNLDSFKEQIVDSTIEEIERGIREKEGLNRDSGTENSFGTYYPETLDSALPNSQSSDENAFFTEVITPNGFPFGGWEKGEDIYTYSLLNDSTEYVYDPQAGTFSKKDK
ncbi:hypothetical protein ACFL6O_03030 [candidate division KSB1 bacterium]